MVKVRLRFFALFREIAGKDSLVWKVRDGTKIEEIEREIRQAIPGLKNHPMIIVVDGEYKEPGYVLEDGDEISVLPPFSGG